MVGCTHAAVRPWRGGSPRALGAEKGGYINDTPQVQRSKVRLALGGAWTIQATTEIFGIASAAALPSDPDDDKHDCYGRIFEFREGTDRCGITPWPAVRRWLGLSR